MLMPRPSGIFTVTMIAALAFSYWEGWGREVMAFQGFVAGLWFATWAREDIT